ncbi:MAG: ParB/RepB/Spo0J family partition protein [Bacteriovoracaceae bacterium]
MSKNFAPRMKKNERSKIDLTGNLSKDIFRVSDDKLLRGAMLQTLRLSKVTVRDQVRTKFNEDSLRELADNIKVNGLIQPLVVHREEDKFVLICGERRYRAMHLIPFDEAPCFILENKSEEELMAIQFSENSAREELHYVDKADGILNYQLATGASERKIQAALGISKSEVHRSLLLAKLPYALKEAAKKFNIEKYVLLEFDAILDKAIKKELEMFILDGKMTKRNELRRALSQRLPAHAMPKFDDLEAKRTRTNVSASLFIKAMKSKSKDMNLDKETQKILSNLMEETKDLVDM